ncbi:hypothetical protein [Pseudofrankia asymbiotica]|uniref:Uncharacterized protein n=1 Tax=Pseudofrankia asymbiotica TaxID=1834516 RepID=A0A1V2I6N0_9ACTN|nr:hypothetical protein [Pseudofrankia asymbiotica]ONH27265.1 hypothetical protein BL253_22085 [Pseudofrankia asymbiotica]
MTMDELMPMLKSAAVDLSTTPLSELRSLRDPRIEEATWRVLADVTDPAQAFCAVVDESDNIRSGSLLGLVLSAEARAADPAAARRAGELPLG